LSAAKSERLMNLLIMLLVQKRFVSKDRIRQALYPDASDEAFEKMFERDKEELRSLGAPIEVGSEDPLFEDEAGYRISAAEFQLPEIVLEPDEAAVVSVATRVWDHAGMAQAAGQAGRKLAADADSGAVDLAALDLVVPRLGADEPSYETFVEAAWTRTAVAFDYARVGRETSRRQLQPWGVVRSSGRWYVVGLDVDRNEQRVFRLSRVVGDVVTMGEPGSFVRPSGVDAAEVVRRLAPPAPEVTATLLVRPGTGHSLRRGARVESAGEWDRVTLARTSYDLAAEVLAHGDDVVVEAPVTLRDEIVRRLDEVTV
jgi:proteasome accessory factor B